MEFPVYSVVIPVYNEAENIIKLYDELLRFWMVYEQSGELFEIVFVDDGSTDKSFSILETLSQKDPRIKIVKLSRNFGHQLAITAGMSYSRGSAIIIMDADLQDSPDVIPRFIEEWKKGYEVVYGIRRTREDGFLKKLTAGIYYRLLRKMTPINIPLDTGDFRLISKRVKEELLILPERHRFVRGLISWIGFKQTGVEFDRKARYKGTTKYPFRKMLKFALDGIISFSYIPLQIASYFGFFVSLISFIYIIWILYEKFFLNSPIIGWSSTMIAILFLGGIQLISIGIIGEYIGRIYDEVKGRPLFIVEKAVNFEDKVKQNS